MRRKISVTIALMVVAGLLSAFANTQAGAEPVECNGKFPIFDDLAQTEEEQAARIACVEERRQVHKDEIAELRSENNDYSKRIQALKRAKQLNKSRINQHRKKLAPLTEVTNLLKYVVGEVTWVYSTAFCESGGTMRRDIHSTSGTYHSFGQFSLPTWRSLFTAQKYGPDPHNEVALVIARGMVELKDRDGDEQWPHCGD